MEKIVIINQHSNNVGDDGAGIALIQQIKEKFENCRIDILYNTSGLLPIEDKYIRHHKSVTFMKKDINIFMKYVLSKFIPFIKNKDTRINELVEVLKGADYVIVSPCGANIGIYKDWYFLMRIIVSILEGHKPVFHLNTIGKSGNRVFDFISKWALKKSKVYVRESRSIKYLETIGISAIRGTDTAFSLKINSDYSIKGKIYSEKYIAFIPTQLNNWHPSFINGNIDESIESKIIPQVSDFCKENNLKIIILPHMIGSSKEYNFLENIKKSFLINGLDEDKVCIAEEVNDVYGYDYVINNAYSVISMRYHGVIFAIKNCVPFISLGYENKMKEACGYSSMLKYNIDLISDKGLSIKNQLEGIKEDNLKIRNLLKNQKDILINLSKLPIQDIYINNLYNPSGSIN